MSSWSNCIIKSANKYLHSHCYAERERLSLITLPIHFSPIKNFTSTNLQSFGVGLIQSELVSSGEEIRKGLRLLTLNNDSCFISQWCSCWWGLWVPHFSGETHCWSGNAGCRFCSTALAHWATGSGRASGESDRSETLADHEHKLLLCGWERGEGGRWHGEVR